MVVLMREKSFKSLAQLDSFIKESADKRQELQDKIKVIDSKIAILSATIEQVYTVTKYHQIYQAYKKDPSNKTFYEEYKAQIILYHSSLAKLKKFYSKFPNSKDILKELDLLQEKNTLMKEYSSSKSNMKELYQIRKNYEKYMGKKMER